MTQFIRQNRWPLFASGFVCGLLVFVVMAFGPLSGSRESAAAPREITLVARENAFNGTNPDVVLQRGQPVRLIIRNEEPGRTLHCFRIPSLDVKTTQNLATGNSETLEFTPTKKGVFAYSCLLHPTMTGKIIIE